MAETAFSDWPIHKWPRDAGKGLGRLAPKKLFPFHGTRFAIGGTETQNNHTAYYV